MLEVVISVSGGVAEVVECPDGVDVTIIDYDDENVALHESGDSLVEQ